MRVWGDGGGPCGSTYPSPERFHRVDVRLKNLEHLRAGVGGGKVIELARELRASDIHRDSECLVSLTKTGNGSGGGRV
jgi:hypothetical protein